MKKWIPLVLTVSLAVSTYMKKLLIGGSLLLLFSCYFNATAVLFSLSPSLDRFGKERDGKGKETKIYERHSIIHNKVHPNQNLPEDCVVFYIFERRITTRIV